MGSMNSLILLFHIAAMIISLTTMGMALGGVLFGHKSAVTFAKFGVVTTVLGAGAGTYLLMLHPAAIQCVVLTSYLVAVGLLYRYVFAMGDVAKCVWIRQR